MVKKEFRLEQIINPTTNGTSQNSLLNGICFDSKTKNNICLLKDGSIITESEFNQRKATNELNIESLNNFYFNAGETVMRFDYSDPLDKKKIDFIKRHNLVSYTDINGKELNDNIGTSIFFRLINTAKNVEDKNSLRKEIRTFGNWLGNIEETHPQLVRYIASLLGLPNDSTMEIADMVDSISDYAEQNIQEVILKLSVSKSSLLDNILVHLCIDNNVITNEEGFYKYKNQEIGSSVNLCVLKLQENVNLKQTIVADLKMIDSTLLSENDETLQSILYGKAETETSTKQRGRVSK